MGIISILTALDEHYLPQLHVLLTSLRLNNSNESPVGKALLGKRVGETVVVDTQAGEIAYKVLDIKRVS